METITIKRKLIEEALDQLKASQEDKYVQSTQNVIDVLELALRQHSALLYSALHEAKDIEGEAVGMVNKKFKDLLLKV